MSARCLACVLLLLTVVPAPAQIEKEAVLRVDADGPTAFVNALAFSPDGKTLYAAGYDKVVRTWSLDKQKFQPASTAYRVPIGPGYDGTITAIALSPDGKGLAVAGVGLVSGRAGFGKPGQVLPKIGGLSDDMRLEQGTIHLFDTEKGTARSLRGHKGPVQALAFAPSWKDKPALLVSLAAEWDGEKYVGGVRLWDAGAAKELAGRQDLPHREGRRPGLAVWHTGDGRQDARVAVASEDGEFRDGKLHKGKFRLWDVSADKWWQPDDAAYNNTVAHLSGQGKVFTGSYSDELNGQLRVWNVPVGQGPEPAVRETVKLARGHFPRALALFPSRPGREPDHAAVIVQIPPPDPNEKEKTLYRLHILGLADGATKAELTLWGGAGQPVPVATADPGGQFLAMGGNKDHQIIVFAVADLLTKGSKAEPLQKLRSAGAAMQYVAFGKKGDDLGLLLSASPAETAGKPPSDLPTSGLVFDFNKATLTAYKDSGWTAASPAMGNWEARPTVSRDDKRSFVSVYREGKEVGWVELPRDRVRTSHALLPPGPFAAPILAIAYHERGETVLTLYQGLTGEPLRQFSGHVNPIRSLAFSADGRLLASVAEDQTVCVWSLTDLKQHLGQQGRVHGLAVQEKGNSLVVAQVNDDDLDDANRKELTAKGVRKDDVLEGIVEKGKLRPLASARDFYNAVWLLKPKQNVTLRIKERGDVVLVVGQGVDERKPLLSLFITRDGKPEERKWIGWNPSGPYDFSDGDAERLLGWHRNTGEADKPVTYALANENRKLHHKARILKYLVAHGNTGDALEAWKKDNDKEREPQMTLWIKEAGPTPPVDDRGRALIRQPPRTLVLTLLKLPSDTQVAAVKWQLNGADQGKLEKTADQTWTADLSKLPWKRGEYVLRVELETETAEGGKYPQILSLYYQPPPPQVLALEVPPAFVSESKYTVKAEVRPTANLPVEVQVRHRYLEKDKEKVDPVVTKTVNKTDTIAQPVELRPGRNVIQVIAENKDAPAGDGAEREYVTLEINYKTPAPSISLTKIVLVPTGEELRIDAGKPELVVGAAEIHIVGAIEAQVNLVEAVCVVDGNRQELALGNNKKKLDIDQKVSLEKKPGRHEIHFLAKTQASDLVKQSVVVDYRPRLPELALRTPAEGQTVHADKIALEGQLFWLPDPHAAQASVVVNGKEQADKPPTLKTGEAPFAAEASLQHGENWVQVKLKNKWHETLTPPIRVTYLRPPRMADKVKESKKGNKSFVDLSGRAESAKDLPLTRLEVNGRELAAQAFQFKQSDSQNQPTVWEFLALNVPVQKGGNRVTLRVGNKDGWSQLITHEFKITEEDLPKAQVQFLDPQRDLLVEDPEHTIHFSVQSESPVTKVELLRNGEVVWPRGAIDLKGRQNFEEKVKLALRQGHNSFKVVAHNDGGEQATPPVVVTYNYRPLRVVIDKLELRDKQELLPLPGVDAGGWLSFSSAAQGQAWVRGRVIGDRDPEQLKKLSELRLYVNGQHQFPVALDAPANNERTFRAEVRLTRAADNEIEVKLPVELTHEASSRRKCRLDCQKPTPARRHRPHLLLIDTGNVDPRELVKRHLDLLKAKPKGADGFTMDGYSEDGIIYGPLTGARVTKEKVTAVLVSIAQNLSFDGAVNDVVFLSFRAGETVTAGSHVFHAPGRPRGAGPESFAISCEVLQEHLGRYAGRGLLLLDVTRAAAETPPAQARSWDRVAQWPNDPHVAVVRLTWWDQPDKQAEDARLLTHLAAALDQARQLNDVAVHLAGKFQKEPPRRSLDPKYKDRLTLDQHVPPSLRDFPLGRPAP